MEDPSLSPDCHKPTTPTSAPADLSSRRFTKSSTARESASVNSPQNASHKFKFSFASRSSRFSIQSSLKRRLSTLSAYHGRVLKSANSYLRWNLLFTFLIVFFISSAVWIPAIPGLNRFAMEIVVIVFIVLQSLWAIGVFNAFRYMARLRGYANHTIDLDKVRGPNCTTTIKHLVGLCIYKEPMELLFKAVDSLASQPDAKGKISLFIGMEEGTPDRELRKAEFVTKYASKFERIIVATHPRGLQGDIPGKCSNLNFAARTAVRQLRHDPKYPLGKKGQDVEVLVTTGDCDTIFGERYFDALEEDFWLLDEKERRRTVWQSPLFYCMQLEDRAFVVRITGLLRSFFMMAYLIPWNINTMSIFSLTLRLFEDGDYTHPAYQMEDIIALIRWSLAVRQPCRIRAIPVATLSGPTSGTSYLNEIYEWARQIRRWTIGAAEVFHYFVIKSRRLPVGTAVLFGAKFIFYYGFMLCIVSIYTIIAPFVTTAMLQAVEHRVKGLVIPNKSTYTWIMLGMLGLQYFWFVCVWLVNRLCEPVFPGRARDKTGYARSFLHLVLAWPSMTAYCLIELFAFLEVTVRGKAVCSHSASKKDGLVAGRQTDLGLPDRAHPIEVV